MSSAWVSEIFCSFQGEGLFAGRRHVFLRLAGCNLRCGWCDTPESLERTASCSVREAGGGVRVLENPLDGADVTGLVAALLEAEAGVHALAITGGEPLVQSGFLGEWLPGASLPVPVLLETNGSFPERLAGVLPWVDIVSMDLKLPSNSGERSLWDEHRAFLAASRGKTVYVKVPVDAATDDRDVERAALLVAEVDRTTPFFLQPIVQPIALGAGPPRVAGERLERFYDLATAHLADVRVLPQAHKALGIP